MNEFNFKSYDNSRQSISYCEVDKCKKVIELREQLDQLKAENEELKTKIESLICSENCYKYKQTEKYKQALQEIKEIVQFGFRPYKVCGEHNNCCDVLNKIWNKISEVVNE